MLLQSMAQKSGDLRMPTFALYRAHETRQCIAIR